VHCLKYLLIFTLLIVLLATGCVNTIPEIPSLEALSQQNSVAKAHEYFIEARDSERRGLENSAIRFYEMAYELDPASKFLRNELIRKYIQNEKYTQALLLAKGEKDNSQLDTETKRIVSTIYLKMGKMEKAAELIESIKEKADEELYSLGLIYESLGNLSRSIDYYLEFYKKQKNAVQLGFKIGKLLFSEKRFAEADSLLSSIKETTGETAQLLVMMGNSKIYNKDTASGLQLLESALSKDSLHEEALRSIAQVYLSRNDFPKAIECYEKLYKNADYGQIYGKTLSLLYYYNNQYEEAESLLKKMLEYDLNDYELHYYLGLVFSAAKKNDLAQIEMEKVLALKPNFYDAWKELCLIPIREKDYDAAEIVAERFTREFSDNSVAWQLHGMVMSLKKEYEKAIRSFRHSISQDSTNAYSWFELGSAFERSKQIDSAAFAFRKVLKLQPDDPAACNYLGYMWAERGINLDSSKILIEIALRQEPDNGAFLDSYAWVFYQFGQLDSAFFYINKAVENIKDDPTVLCHLGDILEKKGRLKEALEAYHKSMELNFEYPEEIKEKIFRIEELLKKNEKQ
jgi:tetratricopeptide (TPR) repeat protein